LRSHRYSRIALQIEAIVESWRRQGKKTRRNWWSVLAGDKTGKPRRVSGTLFPVLAGARERKPPKISNGPAARRAPYQRAITKGVSGAPIRLDDLAARPFVKWAGGKRQLLAAILGQIPREYGRYHEPFVGGGAVFFALSPRNAVLSDSNQRLVRCYTGIKNQVDDVISLLSGYKRNRRFFEVMRRRNVDAASDAEVAAWFIYLNKMGFNGLYRVNSKNRFNVPFGDNKNAQICDEENLRACSRALADAEINCEDFEKVGDRARPNDLVYFDPPYVPLSATSYFTAYTADRFTGEDQIRLRNLALRLKEKGVHVLLSNSSSAAELYSKDFSVIEVLAARAVNSKAERRGKITELLIR
jgi:DNA adenine methylase